MRPTALSSFMTHTCGLGAGIFTAMLVVLGALSVGGCATTEAYDPNQTTFGEPENAVAALIAAVERNDTALMESIFGTESADLLSSGDPVRDRREREVLSVALAQGWTLEPLKKDAMELVIGDEEWPFPIPLVRDRRGWWFDTEAGRAEVLYRRIGRNELATIGALRAYVIAQETYASEGRDGGAAGAYAQRIRSTPGRYDGLFWRRTTDATPPSPLSEFAAQAAAEGYGATDSAGPTPLRGYLFRILTRQGPAAPGGARDFIVDGRMTGGFAMIAWPAAYGDSGIMTFIVSGDGIVYEADLGPETGTVAAAIDRFDPDSRWNEVE